MLSCVNMSGITSFIVDKKLGATVLFFGCRNRNHDYLYQEELEEYERNGVLSGLYVAFSREQVDYHVTIM